MKRYYWATLLVGMALLGSTAAIFAADSEKRLFDRAKLVVSTGTSTCTMSAAVWTNATTVLTIAPQTEHALYNARVVFDLDKATTGFGQVFTSGTIVFKIARKVDGTNWRVEDNTKTTAISGTNAASGAISLELGEVGPDEQVRIMVVLSAETGDFVLPYVVYYRAGARATLTPS